MLRCPPLPSTHLTPTTSWCGACGVTGTPRACGEASLQPLPPLRSLTLHPSAAPCCASCTAPRFAPAQSLAAPLRGPTPRPLRSRMLRSSVAACYNPWQFRAAPLRHRMLRPCSALLPCAAPPCANILLVRRSRRPGVAKSPW